MLRTVASLVKARTGSVAVFNETELLGITSTLGYPLWLVEHLRINPEGLIWPGL